jgi:hypothetical protein
MAFLLHLSFGASHGRVEHNNNTIVRRIRAARFSRAETPSFTARLLLTMPREFVSRPTDRSPMMKKGHNEHNQALREGAARRGFQ